MSGQGQKYGQQHKTKELVEFHNRLHALTMFKLVGHFQYSAHSRLHYAELFCKPVPSEKKRLCWVTVNSTLIASTLFSLLKVLRFHKQSFD